MPAATMSWLAPTVLGVAGMARGNPGAAEARSAQETQRQIYERQIKAFDSLKGVIDQMEGQGAFDPTGRVNQAVKDQGDFERRDLNNTAGAYSILGARPGETPVQSALAQTSVNYKTNFDRIVGDIRRGAIFDRLGAYQALNSGSGSLNPALQTSSSNLAYAQSQDQGFGGLLSNLMPFFSKVGQQKAGTLPVASPGANVSGAGSYMNFNGSDWSKKYGGGGGNTSWKLPSFGGWN